MYTKIGGYISIQEMVLPPFYQQYFLLTSFAGYMGIKWNEYGNSLSFQFDSCFAT